MKQLLAILVALLVMPVAFAVDTGTGIGLDITTQEFAPLIWMCDHRLVVEDCTEAGRMTDCDDELEERTQNYAFEGEQIEWKVLVMDKNKIEQIQEVVATIGDTQGVGNYVEVECSRLDDWDSPPVLASCNARIGEEKLTEFDSDTMAYYRCILTVETQDSMYSENFVTVEVISTDGSATMDENEYWFLNPNVGLTIDGTLTFDDVTPGTVSYSDTLLVTNDADDGSGVLLDMFISGTDFYDPDSSGAKCPTTNHLKLSQDLRSQASLGAGIGAGATKTDPCDIDEWLAANDGGTDNHDHLCYYATNGAYSTVNDDNADAEGYRPIVYSSVFTRDFYNDAEIMNSDADYGLGNVLAPGADIAVTFKLGLPEPCVGDFSDGQIYFWGEAV